jgi:hypothetical protein
MFVNSTEYPGSTFLDQDPETSAHFDGRYIGTVSVSGFSEEYREHQLSIQPMLSLHLEAEVGFPVISLDKIVARIKLVQASITLEDDAGLKEFLGLSM